MEESRHNRQKNYHYLEGAQLVMGNLRGLEHFVMIYETWENLTEIYFDLYSDLQAKPSKQLWVGGLNPSVSKEQLEEEFSKFGKVEDHKFNRERNSSVIEFYRVDEAAAALKNMDGKDLGGEKIRVDYLRSGSQYSKKVSVFFGKQISSLINLKLSSL